MKSSISTEQSSSQSAEGFAEKAYRLGKGMADLKYMVDGLLAQQKADRDSVTILNKQLENCIKKNGKLADALRLAISDCEFVVQTMHEAADPKSERVIVWKDIALHMYSGMNRLPEYRAVLHGNMQPT